VLSKIFKKHKIWINIVSSFGCNKDTAEDIVQEMYIKIQKNINNGLDITYDDDYNYFYIFKTLKSMFLDLKRKESKIQIISIDDINQKNTLKNTGKTKENENPIKYSYYYNEVLKELNKMYWYDKKVFELIDDGTSIAQLSRKTKIPYHSLYNTYRKVIERLKKIL
jgi:DNA-directed RNA polymerase specialized sigma24 family protein